MDFIFDPSLVLYLPLSELDGDSFMSREAYGHLVSVTGAVWQPRGRSFDGTDDWITLPSGLFPANNFTLECWFNSSSVTNQMLFCGTADYYIRLDARAAGQANKCWFYVDISPAGKDVVSDSVLTDGIWHHVVATKSSVDGMKMYVDGVLQADADATATGDALTTTPAVSRIGAWRDGTSVFNGLIGEARIYNRPLNILEIQHNYLATRWRYQ